MKLIGSHTSPFARKVRIVLAEKKIEYEFMNEAPGKPESRVPEFNPLGKVPCLVMEGGEAVFDSRVIVEYLDTRSPVSRTRSIARSIASSMNPNSSTRPAFLACPAVKISPVASS